MPRGRRALPDELKALRGNPGKRKLIADTAVDKSTQQQKPLKPITVEPPAFLTHDREKEIFLRIVRDYLQRRIARAPDLTAYGRWASYVHRWITCKESLDGKSTWFTSESKWGKLLRRHPLFKDMLDLERVLQSLEDRLGLNPIARQNIIRGLASLPPALGGLFDSDPRPDEEPAGDKPLPDQQLPVPEETPLAYLQAAGAKLN